MKTKITISMALGFLTLAFIFNNGAFDKSQNVAAIEKAATAPSPVNSPWNDRFYIGAMNDHGDYGNNFSNLNTLGFNLWQVYINGMRDPNNNSRFIPTGWFGQGGSDQLFADDVSGYAGAVNGVIDNVYNSSPAGNRRRLIIMRPKIEWLCYGQRSDYMCVDTQYIDDRNLWFYTFQSPNHVGYDVQDSKAGPTAQHYVRYCQADPDNPGPGGMVVSRLKANTEQCNRNLGTNVTGGNQWQHDSQSDWLIKPRIRIDSNVAHSVSNPVVCEIKVIAQDDVTILKDVNIHANDFLVDGGSYYNGRYIEEFNLPTGTDLKITGDWAGTDTKGKWTCLARGNHSVQYEQQHSGDNHADIQVYWYGNCDMWIDYVRVDNDVANQLFKGYYEQQGRNWIYDEVSQIGIYPVTSSEPYAMKYYIELCEFNNLPCMAYVNSKIKLYSGGKHVNIVADQLNLY